MSERDVDLDDLIYQLLNDEANASRAEAHGQDIIDAAATQQIRRREQDRAILDILRASLADADKE